MTANVLQQLRINTLKPIVKPEIMGPHTHILMGLRIKDGISMARYETLSGQPLPSHIVSDFIEAGWLALKNDALNATSKGQLVLNYLTQKLLGG